MGYNLQPQMVAVAERLIDLFKSRRNRLAIVGRQIDVANRVPEVADRTRIASRVDHCPNESWDLFFLR